MRVSYISISSHILFMLPAAPTGIKSRGKKETCQVTLYDNSMMARVITRKRKLTQSRSYIALETKTGKKKTLLWQEPKVQPND